MGHELINIIEDFGPTAFSKKRLERIADLFEVRATLFYTPTSNIPERWIGAGLLDVTLPIAPPSRFELRELRGYQTPRVWVDLLQRATGKLRWRPMPPRAIVVVTIYDICEYTYHAAVGAKALVDALKAKTTGRADARLLHYFGAIEDDSPRHIEIRVVQRQIKRAARARTRITVREGPPRR